ncbi:hypothetical protein C2W62_41925 [Candidatus Entotheonella serta]|nr:hypothetical protein C2W62_41925 [Candidatus Entotheonella serta]
MSILSNTVRSQIHLNKSEIVYQSRLYDICKACLATTVIAALKIGALQPHDAAVAYTIHEGAVGYQPEIFHVTNLSTYWTGCWYATKQKAYEAAQAQLITMFQPTQNALSDAGKLNA